MLRGFADPDFAGCEAGANGTAAVLNVLHGEWKTTNLLNVFKSCEI